MANKVDRQIIQEGPRNVVVKFTAALDEGDISLEPALALDDCVGNDPQLRLVGFSGGSAEFSLSAGLQAKILWSGFDPQQMFLVAESGSIGCPVKQGWYPPDLTNDGYDGSIVVSTSGFNPGSTASMTVILHLKKLYAK